MSNALDFLQSVSGYVSSQGENTEFKLAVIDPTFDNSTYPSTLPRVTFDGELTLSGKRYVVAGNYLPSPGDRVVMAPIGHTYAIIGAISSPPSRSLTYAAVGKLVGNVTPTASYQDLNGTTLVVTTRKANAWYDAKAVFDIENSVGGTQYIFLGNLVINGTTLEGEAHESNSGTGRFTVGMEWGATLALPGTYTFNLKARMLYPGSGPSLYETHTKLKLSVFE